MLIIVKFLTYTLNINFKLYTSLFKKQFLIYLQVLLKYKYKFLDFNFNIKLISNTKKILLVHIYKIYNEFFIYGLNLYVSLLCIKKISKVFTIIRSPFVFKKSKELYILNKYSVNMRILYMKRLYIYHNFFKTVILKLCCNSTFFRLLFYTVH
jgi:hypothetical protein